MPLPIDCHDLVVRPMVPADADLLEALQRRVFPRLADAEIITAPKYRRHLEVFPAGQLVAESGGRIVGATSSMRCALTVARHSYLEISDNLWIGTHDPAGPWLYGLDIGVDPAFRGLGVARLLYRARHELVRRLGLAGQFTVGMLNGFELASGELTLVQYYEAVVAGHRNDPTISFQLAIGFEPRGLVDDYLDDPTCGNAGVLLVLSADKTV